MKRYHMIWVMVSAVIAILFISGQSLAENKININTATEVELQSLKDVGPVLAKAIVEYRKINGPFKSPEEIKAVRGIGDKVYNLNKDIIIVADAAVTDEQTKPTEKAAQTISDAQPTFTTDKININTATEAELQSLERVGPAIAKAIVEYRKANGPFRTPEEITAVKGIGDRIYEMNKDMIIVADPEPPADQNR